jgi:hypothetical protein
LIFLLHGRPGVGKTCTAGMRFLGTSVAMSQLTGRQNASQLSQSDR